jgi:hypothetical protein
MSRLISATTDSATRDPLGVTARPYTPEHVDVVLLLVPLGEHGRSLTARGHDKILEGPPGDTRSTVADLPRLETRRDEAMSTEPTASRPPLRPPRESIPEADRADYDFVYERVEKLTGRSPDEIAYVAACLNSPPFAASLWKFSGRMLANFSTSDAFSHIERDYMNIVLAFDFGYYSMEGIVGHLTHAVECLGLRPEMPRAVWEGREDDLTPNERQLVDYIRAYINGSVTAEMWSGIVERFGSVRSAVEYTLALGYNLLCFRTMQAFGVPSVSREEMQKVLDSFGTNSDENRRGVAGLDQSLRDPEFVAKMASS